MKLSKTAIRELTKRYRAVLLGCIMAGLGLPSTANATVDVVTNVNTSSSEVVQSVDFSASSFNKITITGVADQVKETLYTTAEVDAAIAAEKSRAEGVEGTLTNLTTEAKGNLVAAINEVDAHADANTATIGDVKYAEDTSSDSILIKNGTQTVEAGLEALDAAIGSAHYTGDGIISSAGANVYADLNTLSQNSAGKSLDNTFKGTNTFKEQVVTEKGVKFGEDYSIGSDGSAKLSKVTTGDAGVVVGTSGNSLTSTGLVAKSASIGTAGQFSVSDSGVITMQKNSNVNANTNTVVQTNYSESLGDYLDLNTGFSAADGKFTVSEGSGDTSISGNTSISGSLTIGEANTISSTLDTINFNDNNLTGIDDLTADGNVNLGSANSVVNLQGTKITMTAATDVKGSMDVTGLSTFESGFKLGSDEIAVTSVNHGDTVTGNGNGSVLATTATLMQSAENAKFTVKAGEAKNFTSTNAPTIASALYVLDSEIGADTDYSSDNNGVSGNKSIKANIDAINTNLGNVASVDVNGYSPATKTLTGAVNALNDNMETVLGGMYATNGSYNALTGNGFNLASGTASTLTQQLSDYSKNVAAATGTVYAENGTFTNNYSSVNKGIGYDIQNTDSLVTAIGVINQNVGDVSTLSETNGNLKADNTVVANLNKLDTAIGNRKVSVGNTADYTYSAGAANSVTETLNQLATNIGSAVETTNNGVLAANSVNANIDAINANLGNVADVQVNGYNPTAPETKTLTSAVTALNTNMNNVLGDMYATNGEYTALSGNGFVQEEENDLTTQLSGYAQNVATATGGTFADNGTWTATVDNADSNGYTYTEANNIMATVNQVAGNIGTADQLSFEKNGVTSTNTVNENINTLNTALGDMSTLSGNRYARYTNVADNLSALDRGLSDVNHRVSRLDRRMKGGFASLAALSALQPNARASGDTQISAGTGMYRGRAGMALGAFHYFNDNVMGNLGVSYAGSTSTTFRAGVTFGW